MADDNFTTYCIYRIVCFQTGKVYVGKSLAPHSRQKIHWKQLSLGIHHSVKLQSAYNKYGRQAFYFEVLEKDISELNVEERERYWIAQFNSHRNGYNMTVGGSFGGNIVNPCVWNSIQYPSITAAARSCNITESSMWERLDKGYTCDTDIPGIGSNQPQSKPIVWNNTTYSSVNAAARACGIHRSVMGERIKKGYTNDADVKAQHFKGRPVTWDGVEYPSLTVAAKALGITVPTMKNRADRGFSNSKDFTYKNRIMCTWNGVEYPSLTEASRCLGISIQTLTWRLKNGCSSDDDMRFKRKRRQ